jgi:hypothetical protein
VLLEASWKELIGPENDKKAIGEFAKILVLQWLAISKD